ncbi:pyridoxal phosphate-dependent aminotransferase [Spirochaetota bacterium]
MNFAKRILQIKPSPTLGITALANDLKAKGVDVIGFGSGEPDFDTPKFIKDAAIRAIESGKTKYTPVGGISELKEAVVTKFKKDNNLSYEISEITVNCGGKHSFYNLMQVLIDNKDEVIIPSPYWVSYPSMVLLAGGKPVIIDTSEDNSFKITPEQLSKTITSKTKAIVINSPSNPTGAAYSRDELKNLAEILVNKDIIIITDDIYESIVFDGFEFTNIANISDELKKKTIVLNGVSKKHSMTGWRIGYMAGDSSIIKKVEILQSQSTSNPTSISQWASVAALTGSVDEFDVMLDAFIRRRDFIVNGLNNINGISCFKPNGAFYAFPRVDEIYKMKNWKMVNDRYDDEFKSSKLCSFLLEEAKVAVVPGIAFGNDNNLRMSFATSDENIKEGLKRIKEAVQSLD